MPTDWFRRHTHINETHAAILRVAQANPNRIANVVLMVEDSRKKGWCAFYESIRGQVRNWRREGVRRETLTTAHREVQNSRFVASSSPPHFLKMIQLGYEAMISKWGPPNPALSAKIEALQAMLPEMSAKVDEPTLAAFQSGIAALEAQKPEQESETCMICLEPIVANEVFGEGEGIMFSNQCMHAMHEACIRNYFNNRPTGHLPWGADGTPLEGKKVPCPKCREGIFTRQYVENFRQGRELGSKERAEEAQRARKRDAEAMQATDASPDEEDALVPAPETEERGEPPIPIDGKPKVPGHSPEQIQDWINRKVEAGHYRFLEARHKSGVLYQFVVDGTVRDTYPKSYAIKLAYPTFHGHKHDKPNFKLVDPKNGKEISAWGKALPGGEAQSSASGSV